MNLGTALTESATRVLLCGGGELGKEVVIELQRLGVETIVVDRYANAPAMQVAHRAHVISMLDGDALREVIEREKPEVSGRRRMGVALARGTSIDEALDKAKAASAVVKISL